MRRTATVALALALASSLVTAGAASAQGKPGSQGAPRDVMFVGNNWDGTASVVDARTHTTLRTLNMIPDRSERMTEILTNPDKLAFYLAIQQRRRGTRPVHRRHVHHPRRHPRGGEPAELRR